MLNSKGFQLPRAFNLNGLVNNIQGQSLLVKKNETEQSQNHQIGGFEEKTTNFVISGNTETTTQTTTTATVVETAETTPAKTSTPSLLTLTNDEIHTLEHFIQRRYDSDKKNADELTASILLIAEAMKTGQIERHEESSNKKNANLRNLQLVITDVDKKGNKLDRYNFTTCFSNGNVPNTIKKEGKDVVQSIINNQIMNNFAPEILLIRNQVVALITSVNTIRQSHPMVNDIYEQKSKKVIFVLGNVVKSEEKAEYILNFRINEELEHQKYVNKPYGIYYIDNKKATEMLNSKGFELPRAFNLNGL